MPRGKRCVISAWTLDAASSPAAWRLRVRPLCAFREVDALTMANADANMSLRREDCLSAIAPYPGCPEMFFHAGRAEVKAEGCWYYRFQHPWDVALGREGTEDLFSPCELTYSLAPGQGVALVAGTEKVTDDPERLEANERDRRAAVGLPDMGNDPTAHALARAAEAFIVRTADGHARILATYPEPMEDLRSALLALPGILLCTRKLEEAKSLLTWGMAALVGEGSAASRLCGAMDDTPLWLIRAGELYVDHSRDWDFLRDELSPGCEALAQRYIENRSPSGYRLAPDGLLTSGEDPQPLTWMNAKMEDWAVTPRAGKPVEVNALWHHALGLLARWAGRRGRAEQAERLASLRELCGRSFRHRFWNEAENCLFDVVDVPEGGASAPADAAIRPNQLFAVSLPSDLLERRQAAGVLSGVENRLLAPCGLRTLSLEDMAFRPRYAGGVVERAAARHQGAIHPWLIGAYVDAIFRVHGRTPRAYARAEVCLEPLLREHLREACVGQISELFHGASPHTPQGAFAHAPAVGEIIRAYAEIKGRMP
jgi:predicted glycogen debranching enzyme